MNTERSGARRGLEIASEVDGDAGLLRLFGPIDETFESFEIPAVSSLSLDLSGLSRITSYGVRQWLRALDAVPPSVQHIYFLSCPSIFVAQMNMVLNFCGRGRVVTVMTSHSCEGCGLECSAVADVLAHGAELAAGRMTKSPCPRCNAPLEMDDLPESYFAFAKVYGATALDPLAARLLAKTGLYRRAVDNKAAGADVAAKTVKLVHDQVTYFKIVGPIDGRFRARPFLHGLEGEVVLDLHDVSALTDEGAGEWTRLLGQLADQVSGFALVDIPPPLMDAAAAGRVGFGRGLVYSVLAPYRCDGCGRESTEGIVVARAAQPIASRSSTCPVCGAVGRFVGAPDYFAPAERAASGRIPAATLEVIVGREELLSRALVEAFASPRLGRARSEGILGKYKIIRARSVGGMAEVFLAVQKGIGGFEKSVALKRVRRQMLKRKHLAVELFLNEAKIAANLNHPNIAQIYEVGEEDGLLYLAMEYVNGKDLRLLLKKLYAAGQTLPLDIALFVTKQVALALHHAYTATDLSGRQLKAVHRDVSPHNVVIAFDGTVKLVDFGVAVSASTPANDRTQLSGKCSYMSPEQTDCRPLDGRSDLYSLGVVLYQACTNHRPCDPVTGGAQRVVTPSQRNPRLPPAFDRLLLKMLAERPEDRFANGREVADAIDALARGLGIELRQERLADLVAANFPRQDCAAEANDGADGTPQTRPGWRSGSDSETSTPVITIGTPMPGPGSLPRPSASSAASTTRMPLLSDSASLRALDAEATVVDLREPPLDEESLNSIINPPMTGGRIRILVALTLSFVILAVLWWFT